MVTITLRLEASPDCVLVTAPSKPDGTGLSGGCLLQSASILQTSLDLRLPYFKGPCLRLEKSIGFFNNIVVVPSLGNAQSRETLLE